MKEKYMLEAMKQAKKAALNGDIPVGAVIVKNDKIISRAYNKREKTKNAINHAEIIAIRKACSKIGDWRLNGCTLYVTLEPCSMCMGAAVQARIDKIMYATKSYGNSTSESEIEAFEINNFDMKRKSSEMIKNFFNDRRK